MPWKRRGLRGIPSNGWSTRTACTARSRLAFRCPRARRPYGSARLLTRQAKGVTNRNVRLEAHKRGNIGRKKKLLPQATPTPPVALFPQGVYQATVRAAADTVMNRRARSRDFQLISGYSGWAPFQLAAELQDQAW